MGLGFTLDLEGNFHRCRKSSVDFDTGRSATILSAYFLILQFSLFSMVLFENDLTLTRNKNHHPKPSIVK